MLRFLKLQSSHLCSSLGMPCTFWFSSNMFWYNQCGCWSVWEAAAETRTPPQWKLSSPAAYCTRPAAAAQFRKLFYWLILALLTVINTTEASLVNSNWRVLILITQRESQAFTAAFSPPALTSSCSFPAYFIWWFIWWKCCSVFGCSNSEILWN